MKTISEITLDQSLSAKEKAKQIQKIKNAEEAQSVEGNIPAELKPFFTDERKKGREKAKINVEHLVDEEEREEAGDIIEIFSDYVTINGVDINIPNVQSMLIIQRMYGSLAKAMDATVGDITTIGILNYIISNQYNPGFSKMAADEITEKATEWWSQFDIAEVRAITYAFNRVWDLELKPKKKLNLRTTRGDM